MEFSRQEYWSGLPFPSPGNLPIPGTEPRSPALQADSLLSDLRGKPLSDLYLIITQEWKWAWPAWAGRGTHKVRFFFSPLSCTEAYTTLASFHFISPLWWSHVISIVRMRKWSLKEVREFGPGHLANKLYSQDMNLEMVLRTSVDFTSRPVCNYRDP